MFITVIIGKSNKEEGVTIFPWAQTIAELSLKYEKQSSDIFSYLVKSSSGGWLKWNWCEMNLHGSYESNTHWANLSAVCFVTYTSHTLFTWEFLLWGLPQSEVGGAQRTDIQCQEHQKVCRYKSKPIEMQWTLAWLKLMFFKTSQKKREVTATVCDVFGCGEGLKGLKLRQLQ